MTVVIGLIVTALIIGALFKIVRGTRETTESPVPQSQPERAGPVRRQDVPAAEQAVSAPGDKAREQDRAAEYAAEYRAEHFPGSAEYRARPPEVEGPQ
jgi:hypothetical protein